MMPTRLSIVYVPTKTTKFLDDVNSLYHIHAQFEKIKRNSNFSRHFNRHGNYAVVYFNVSSPGNSA